MTCIGAFFNILLYIGRVCVRNDAETEKLPIDQICTESLIKTLFAGYESFYCKLSYESFYCKLSCESFYCKLSYESSYCKLSCWECTVRLLLVYGYEGFYCKLSYESSYCKLSCWECTVNSLVRVSV